MCYLTAKIIRRWILDESSWDNKSCALFRKVNSQQTSRGSEGLTVSKVRQRWCNTPFTYIKMQHRLVWFNWWLHSAEKKKRNPDPSLSYSLPGESSRKDSKISYDIREEDWTCVWLTVELKRRWQMLQEMMGFFLGGATPKVWLITAFCTGSIYDEKHTTCTNTLVLLHVFSGRP